MIKVMSFDLSTVCVGVVAGIIDDNGKIETLRSAPIIPTPFSPSSLGYMKSKKYLATKTGEKINTYYKKGEQTITKTEKKRRDKTVRDAKNNFVLADISKRTDFLVKSISPDIVLVERNETFNGVLTTEVLAKTMGLLISICSVKNIPLKEFPVGTARKILNIPQLLISLRDNNSPEWIMGLPDVTKRAIREFLVDKYSYTGIEVQTDDESDALAIFNYWYEEEYKCQKILT